jgi:hypothetical protein
MMQTSCFAGGAVALGSMDADLQRFWICFIVATGASLLFGAGLARAPWHPDWGEAPIEWRHWWLWSGLAGVVLGSWWGYASTLAGFDQLAYADGEIILHQRFQRRPQSLDMDAIEEIQVISPPKFGEEGAGLVLHTSEGRYESVSMRLSEARALRRRLLACRDATRSP